MSEVSQDSNPPGRTDSNGGAGGLQWTIESGVRPKAWQLSAAVMMANGSSQANIARLHGMDVATVSNLVRQRWFGERVEQLMAANHKSITELFRAELLASLARLVDLRDNAMSEAVRAHCAEVIIERTMGKASVQVPEEKSAFTGDPVEEVRQIQAELDRGYEERHRLDPPKGQ